MQIIPKYFEFISMILRDNFILIGNKNTIFAQLLHLTVLVIFDREKSGWPKSISNVLQSAETCFNQPGRF